MKIRAGLVAELMQAQREMAAQVISTNDLDTEIDCVAGVDAAFPDGGTVTRGAAVLMSFPDLELIDQAVVELETELPYIPGLLSFRELPAIQAALTRLCRRPALVLCDGQGRAHPRRFGIACHLGVATGLATLGVGKSRLCGQHAVPGTAKGDRAALMDGEEIIGQVLRTRSGVKPVFVSVGHRLQLDQAVDITLACTTRYRLPEPIRAADRLAGDRARQ